MRSKLNFLINVSLKKKINSKWFLVANIIIAILMLGIINIDSIITLFGGDFDSKTKIYIVDESNKLSEIFKSNLEYYESTLYGENSVYEIIISKEKIDEIKKKIIEEETTSLLIEFKEENNKITSKLISLSTIDSYDYQLINNSVSSTINLYNLNSIDLTQEQYQKLLVSLKM